MTRKKKPLNEVTHRASRCLFYFPLPKRDSKERCKQKREHCSNRHYLPFFSTKQCVTMRGKQRQPLWGERQNESRGRLREVAEENETKRDERDDLHCAVFSHSCHERHRRGLLQGRCQLARTITPRLRHDHAAHPNTLGEHCRGKKKKKAAALHIHVHLPSSLNGAVFRRSDAITTSPGISKHLAFT